MNYLIAYLGTGAVFAIYTLVSVHKEITDTRANLIRSEQDHHTFYLTSDFYGTPEGRERHRYAVTEMRKIRDEFEQTATYLKSQSKFIAITAVLLWPLQLVLESYRAVRTDLYAKKINDAVKSGKKRV